MGLTLILIAGAAFALRLLGASRWAQGAVVAISLAFVVLVQLTLPPTSALRVATGGSLANWLILLAVLAVVGAYSFGIKALKQRAEDRVEPVQKTDKLSETELDRYARHIVLREIGGPGQQKLRKARVLVVGAGGLGAPVLQYLAAAGVGTIGVIDDDIVSLSNLQRQVLFSEDELDTPKVFAAQKRLKGLNPFVEVQPYNRRITEENSAELVGAYDLVLDGTDSFATRALVNKACVAAGVPLVSGAIGQWEGQVTVFDPAHGDPCYACLFPEEPADGLAPSCAEAGVVGALPGIIGSMMAAEAIKEITGAGQVLRGSMLIFDALYGESRKIQIERRDGCAVCGGI
ncbi:HesA/MoeB/ThiF family protein [Neptunicoccus cionae]|uniref:Molybdopterin-synthase adenylyltransferase n=1 Tax=Neptunicoccus cionae TaxID=2035344 RepID=A0A916QW05_9RHOB|nr:HesA/MoeB/ThiF family protein [Amylibacter cionae]GGA15831.1 molybdopterin biosynthesis protein [Amylibacter cionae]